VAQDQKTQTVAGDIPPSDIPSTEGGGTPVKPRSGFQRQKIKIARLTELYSNLQDDYEALLADHDRLLADSGKLESAFNEITELNASLAAELRHAKQQRPGPVRYGSLMGT
jgi:hypothetical protein